VSVYWSFWSSLVVYGPTAGLVLSYNCTGIGRVLSAGVGNGRRGWAMAQVAALAAGGLRGPYGGLMNATAAVRAAGIRGTCWPAHLAVAVRARGSCADLCSGFVLGCLLAIVLFVNSSVMGIASMRVCFRTMS